jgi:replicative DNA helicase
MTSTQLNADYITAQQYDQNLLRGAKAIADKIDLGAIMLEVSQDDLKALDMTIKQNNLPKPAIKMSIYKNRRGRYKGVYLWVKADYGTCRFKPMFATTWDYEIIQMQDLKIITSDEEGAF